MSKRNVLIAIIVFLALAAVVIMGIQSIRLKHENERQKEDLVAAEQLLEFEKMQAQEDLLTMQAEVNEYSAMAISNDSLIAMIDEQKQKIQLLLDEIKTVKATDAKRIKDLKDELSVVRSVLYDYIRQVDSLNRINTALRNENAQVREQMKQVDQRNAQLTKQKEDLSAKVTRAAMIDVSIEGVRLLTKKGKETSKLSKVQSIAIDLDIAKNVTTSVGYKTIYLRVMQPDGDVITRRGDTFKFEGNYIAFTAKKDIEYKGERMQETIFYKVNTTLLPGTYKADIFIDGAALASKTFVIKK